MAKPGARTERIRSVPCPTCGSLPGGRCVTVNGDPVYDLHPAREVASRPKSRQYPASVVTAQEWQRYEEANEKARVAYDSTKATVDWRYDKYRVRSRERYDEHGRFIHF